MAKTHIIGMVVDDQPGVMARISGLFSRRGFNISTITVGKTNVAGASRMVFAIEGEENSLEQIVKQVNKLVSVIKIAELRPNDSVIRELCLIKVNIRNESDKNDIFNLANVFKAKIVDITKNSAVMEISGTPEKIDSFVDNIKSHGIKEISRTGATAISRGAKALEGKEAKWQAQ